MTHFIIVRAESKYFRGSHVSPTVSKGCPLGKEGGGRQGDYTPVSPISHHFLNTMISAPNDNTGSGWPPDLRLLPFHPTSVTALGRFHVYRYAH